MTLNETPDTAGETGSKSTKKELLLHELKEIFAIMIYLWVSLSLLSTIKSLVLVQQGINDFADGYQVAAVLALGAAKVVVLAQNLKLMKAWDSRPLIWAVLYKSTLMALIVDGALKLEEKLFHHNTASQAAAAHPIVLLITHQVVLLSIFVVLFLVRGLDRELGPGRLSRLIFSAKTQKI